MAKQSSAQIEKAHEHWWVTGNDYSSEKCNCGFIRISPMEYEMRVKAWESYFELVKTTSSYLDHQEYQVAFKTKDFEKMKQLTEKIKQRTHKNDDGELELDDPLPKPSFPDPATWNKYMIGGA